MAIILDKAGIMENFMHDEELLFESIDLFNDRVVSRMGTLKAAVETNDLEATMAEAHTIKGMVGIFSIGEAFEAAKHLELKTRDKSGEGIEADFVDLQTKMNSLVEALTEWRSL